MNSNIDIIPQNFNNEFMRDPCTFENLVNIGLDLIDEKENVKRNIDELANKMNVSSREIQKVMTIVTSFIW